MAQLHLGVLLAPEGVELLDCAPVGLFDELSKDYLKGFPAEVFAPGFPDPQGFRDNAPDIKFHWIAEGGTSVTAPTTASGAFRVTDDFKSCPQLDFLLIPGPDPFVFRMSNETKEFIVSQVNGGLYALLTICSGVFLALHSGVLDGKKATAPKFLIPTLATQHPTVKFDTLRYVADATGPNKSHTSLKKSDSAFLSKFDREKNGTELWTSGQVLNGVDMVAQFIKEKFPPEYANWVIGASDCPLRGAEYPDA